MSGPLRYVVFAALDGHTSGITAVAFSPNGLYLATAGLDSRLCVWRVADKTPYHSYAGSTPILSLAWLPDEHSTLICGMKDGSIMTLELDQVSPPYKTVSRSNQILVRSKSHSFLGSHIGCTKSRYPRPPSSFRGRQRASYLGYTGQWYVLRSRSCPNTVHDPRRAGGCTHIVDLPEPPTKTSYNEDQEVLITSIHWTRTDICPSVLLVTYMYHGIA